MAKKTEKEWRATLSKARQKGSDFAKEAKPLGMAAAVGGVAQYAGDMAAERIDFLKDNWYGQPAAKMLGAILLRKKNKTASLSLAAVAGHQLAFNYKLNQFQKGESTDNPVPTFKQEKPAIQPAAAVLPAAPGVTPVQAQIDAGYLHETFDDPTDDTGYLQDEDAGYLQDEDDTGELADYDQEDF